MRILLVGNAPWAPTGYGTQLQSLATRLQKAGHEVSFFANWGLRGGAVKVGEMEVLPSATEKHNDLIIHGHVARVQPDIVLTMFDSWASTNYGGQQWRWVSWTPIDHLPIPASLHKVIPNMWRILSMSAFGHQALLDAGITNTLIPLGVEKDFYHSAEGRRKFRTAYEIPDDAFLFGQVGLNIYYPGRKGFDRSIEALKMLVDKGVNAYLYCHTLEDGLDGALDMGKVAEMLGVRDRVIFPPPYEYTMGYSRPQMAGMYSAFDCLLEPSNAEGFGLPVVEAQACGCPVIATDCTSLRELACPDASILVSPATHYIDHAYAFQWLIDIPQLAAAMEEAVEFARLPQIKARCGLWANNWDWDKLFQEEWIPYLGQLEDEIRASTGHGALLPDHLEVQEALSGGLTSAKLLLVNDRNSGQEMVAKVDVGGYCRDMPGEIATLQSLCHPNIVQIIDSGTTRYGRPYFLMPRYERTLAQIETLTEEEAVHILGDVRAAIEYLTNRGIAHRDLHETNILIDRDGHAVLCDFAWAEAIPHDTTSVDWTGYGSHAVPTVQRDMDARGFPAVQAAVLKRYKPELYQLLKEQRATGLTLPYQQVLGIGERDVAERWDQLKPDVAGKRVIDLGCNLGLFCQRAVAEGASWAMGVDRDPKIIQAASLLGGPCTFFEMRDIDALETGDLQHFDVAFVLGLLMHVNLPRLMRLLREIADTVYIEAPRMKEYGYSRDSASWATFFRQQDWQCTELGQSDRQRPIFRLDQKVRALHGISTY